MAREGIDAEHARLRREVEDLQREHDTLENKPIDREEHKAHRRRLSHQIEQLRAHIERLRTERPIH